jgi:17beta-estradiol 17-dehydrogenase / very-long-chain 3-oxoacyl-CoA reductase
MLNFIKHSAMKLLSAIPAAITLIGSVLLLYMLYCTVDFFLFHLITPPNPLHHYLRPGHITYALITGGNGGIGYGIALSLLQHGFGVILLGRNSAKLDTAAEELMAILESSGLSLSERVACVRTIVLDPYSATAEEIESCVLDSIVRKGIQVSILVNNVGSAPIAYPPYRELYTYSAEDIEGTIRLNAIFMAHLTVQMIPVLSKVRSAGSSAKERGSLILNLSSGAKIGLPYQVLYASTKGFNHAFSLGLSRELELNPKTKHIKVLSILAGDVLSQGNIAGLTKGSPDWKTYGRLVVEKADAAIRRGWREMSPFWRHHLDFIILSFTPDRVLTKGLWDIMCRKKGLMNEATRAKDH